MYILVADNFGYAVDQKMYATVSIPSIVDWTVRAEQVSQLLLCVSVPLRSALADPK